VRAGRDRAGPRLGDLVEDAALVGGVALDGLDQVGNQVMAALELDVDVRKRLLDPLPECDQPVVGEREEDHDDDDDRQHDEPAE